MLTEKFELVETRVYAFAHKELAGEEMLGLAFFNGLLILECLWILH